jgi:hypothetical protein
MRLPSGMLMMQPEKIEYSVLTPTATPEYFARHSYDAIGCVITANTIASANTTTNTSSKHAAAAAVALM